MWKRPECGERMRRVFGGGVGKTFGPAWEKIRSYQAGSRGGVKLFSGFGEAFWQPAGDSGYTSMTVTKVCRSICTRK